MKPGEGMVMLALVLMLLGIALLALEGCGANSVRDKNEQEYTECIDSGGEWVQIAENQWTCQRGKEGTE